MIPISGVLSSHGPGKQQGAQPELCPSLVRPLVNPHLQRGVSLIQAVGGMCQTLAGEGTGDFFGGWLAVAKVADRLRGVSE